MATCRHREPRQRSGSCCPLSGGASRTLNGWMHLPARASGGRGSRGASCSASPRSRPAGRSCRMRIAPATSRACSPMSGRRCCSSGSSCCSSAGSSARRCALCGTRTTRHAEPLATTSTRRSATSRSGSARAGDRWTPRPKRAGWRTKPRRIVDAGWIGIDGGAGMYVLDPARFHLVSTDCQFVRISSSRSRICMSKSVASGSARLVARGAGTHRRVDDPALEQHDDPDEQQRRPDIAEHACDVAGAIRRLARWPFPAVIAARPSTTPSCDPRPPDARAARVYPPVGRASGPSAERTQLPNVDPGSR